MQGQKPRPGLARDKDFTVGGGLFPKMLQSKLEKFFKNVKVENVVSVIQTYHRLGLGSKPRPTGQFLQFFWIKQLF